jgi:predicted NBD/HSP70 family sugar kinase
VPHVSDPSTPKTRSALLHALLAHGAALTAEARDDRMSHASFWSTLSSPREETGEVGIRDLLSAGLIESDWSLSRSLGEVLALSLGTESARGALVDANGRTSAEEEAVPTSGQLLELSPELVLNRLAAVAHAVLSSAIESRQESSIKLIGVAVAWPAPLEAATKVGSTKALRHPGWAKQGDLRMVVAQRLALEGWAGSLANACERSHAINDANAVALADAFRRTRSRARRLSDDSGGGAVLAVRVGGGIGAGVVLLADHDNRRLSFLNSHLIEGRGYAGEIAHLPVSHADVDELAGAGKGLKAAEPLPGCGCGRASCLDAVASARAIVERVRQAGVLDGSLHEGHADTEAFRTIVDNVRQKPVALALEQAGQLIGRALAGPVMLLNPKVVVISGSAARPQLLAGISKQRPDWLHVHDESYPSIESDPDPLAPLRGAGLAALRGALFRRFHEYSPILRVPLPYTEEHIAALGRTLSVRPYAQIKRTTR